MAGRLTRRAEAARNCVGSKQCSFLLPSPDRLKPRGEMESSVRFLSGLAVATACLGSSLLCQGYRDCQFQTGGLAVSGLILIAQPPAGIFDRGQSKPVSEKKRLPRGEVGVRRGTLVKASLGKRIVSNSRIFLGHQFICWIVGALGQIVVPSGACHYRLPVAIGQVLLLSLKG